MATAAIPKREVDALFDRVASIIDNARSQAVRSVNTAMVHAYWQIGKQIIEVEQQGQLRASYGGRLMAHLARSLCNRYGRGFGEATLKRARQFFLTYPEGSAITKNSALGCSTPGASTKSVPIGAAVLLQLAQSGQLFPASLGWTHYIILMRVSDPRARVFYEIEATRECWSTRELERQIGSLLFERLARNCDREQELKLAEAGHQVTAPADIIKDPLVLEFLDLDERAHWRERDLEQAIIDLSLLKTRRPTKFRHLGGDI